MLTYAHDVKDSDAIAPATYAQKKPWWEANKAFWAWKTEGAIARPRIPAIA